MARGGFGDVPDGLRLAARDVDGFAGNLRPNVKSGDDCRNHVVDKCQIGDRLAAAQQRQRSTSGGAHEARQQGGVAGAEEATRSQDERVEIGSIKHHSLRLRFARRVGIDGWGQWHVLGDRKLIGKAEINAGGGDVDEAPNTQPPGKLDGVGGAGDIGGLKSRTRAPVGG